MVSGDPGYYSLLPWLKKRFAGNPIEVIPGISSVQSAFALITEPWQGALWLSFHGRIPDDEQLRYEKGKKMAFLTDHEHNPSYIAKYLIKKDGQKKLGPLLANIFHMKSAYKHRYAERDHDAGRFW